MSDARDTAAPVALVTGGGTGIGLGIARALKRDGWKVILAGRRAAPLEAQVPQGFEALPLDVCDRAALADAAARIAARHLGLSGLVNAAGIVRAGPIDSLTDADIAAVLATNLQAVVDAIRAFLPLLLTGGGSILNIGSTLANRPTPGTAIYSATKGAIDALTRALAVELGPRGVRVNCIHPALVRSDIWLAAGMPAERYDTLLARRGAEYPLGRVGEPEDVAGFAAFLMSPAASWVTGACVPVDGGASINTVPRG